VIELMNEPTDVQVRIRDSLVVVATESRLYDIETELTTAQARILAKNLTTAADNIDAEASRVTA
jgi:hypothetical protein